MRKHLVAGALVVAMAFGTLAAAGCSGPAPAEDVNANVPAGAPPLMPATHQDRFETLGASGCYGCHCASERSNPMLNGSKAMPEDHYANGSSQTLELDPTHDQCNTCHVQG